MIAALVVLDLHLPGCTSLKAKRGPLKSVVSALRRELGVSVAEIGHQDLWQRAVLGVAIAATSETGARKVAQSVEKMVQRDPRIEVVGIHVEIVQTD